MPGPITFVSVKTQEQAAVIRELFLEYAAAIGVDLEYQGFIAELAALPSPYVPPHGALFIARINGETAGCVALRRIGQQTGEMKRLYVRPAFRSWGLGKYLIGETIQAARRAGYTMLRLDTPPVWRRRKDCIVRLVFTRSLRTTVLICLALASMSSGWPSSHSFKSNHVLRAGLIRTLATTQECTAMKHLVTVLFFVGAVAAYMAGNMPGAAVLLIVGIALELVGWYRVFRGKRRSGAPMH